MKRFSRPRRRSRNKRRTGTDGVIPEGKRRLIAAGLRLAARGRGLSSLGLRELAREAELNPNTFYRHFKNIDELGIAAVEEVTRKLRLGLKEVRRRAATHADATRGSAEYFLEFARENSRAFIVGVREIHGGSPAIRAALRKVMDEIAAEVTDDLREMGFGPPDERSALLEVVTAMVDLMFYRSLEYIERPAERRAIVERCVRLARILFTGATNAEQ
jgi:TetR/AcrR family transcriptional regulator, fatty acid biosynthesis regulator